MGSTQEEGRQWRQKKHAPDSELQTNHRFDHARVKLGLKVLVTLICVPKIRTLHFKTFVSDVGGE